MRTESLPRGKADGKFLITSEEVIKNKEDDSNMRDE